MKEVPRPLLLPHRLGGSATSGSDPPPPIEVTVDRPFIFLIRDRATNAIVFVGRVVQLDEAAQ